MTPAPALRWLGPLRDPLERFLSGGSAPLDPLYLSNRTLPQKATSVAAFLVPSLLIGGLMFVALGKTRKLPQTKPDVIPADMAKRVLPAIEQTRVESNRDVEVLEVRLDRSNGTALAGTVRNNTTHLISSAEIIFEVVDRSYSGLGGVMAKLENLPAGSSRSFRLPIEQSDAMLALVREVKIR